MPTNRHRAGNQEMNECMHTSIDTYIHLLMHLPHYIVTFVAHLSFPPDF